MNESHRESHDKARREACAATRDASAPLTSGVGLHSERLGGVPIINHFLHRAGVPALLTRYLPDADARTLIDTATAVRLIVTNLLLGRKPLYKLDEWASPFAPHLLGLTPDQHARINDDRVGRALTGLFHADRGSLLTELILNVVTEFGIDTKELHNDSTSISVHGNYRDSDGSPRDGLPTPHITFGHSKDHRPDLKQLVWILTVTSDGAVPVTYRLTSGNTSDDPTHIPTWDALASLLGSTDFLYIADSKLASHQAMGHIDSHGGHFITVLPKHRQEVTAFREWIRTHTPDWDEALRRPAPRKGAAEQVYSTLASPIPNRDGYRVIWIHSTAKADRDKRTRHTKIDAGIHAIHALNTRLAGPKCRLKTVAAITHEADTVLTRAGASQWVTFTITEIGDPSTPNATAPATAPPARARKPACPRHTITADTRSDVIAGDARTDGCFPLITNDTTLTDADVLAAYKYQPHLERRHHLLKSVQHADPILLRDPARIEALFCCQFIALLIAALIEREIRTAMKTAGTTSIPLYPELRACPHPSSQRILEIFGGLARHHIHQNGQHITTIEADLTPLQQQVLDLLGIPETRYTQRF